MPGAPSTRTTRGRGLMGKRSKRQRERDVEPTPVAIPVCELDHCSNFPFYFWDDPEKYQRRIWVCYSHLTMLREDRAKGELLKALDEFYPTLWIAPFKRRKAAITDA